MPAVSWSLQSLGAGPTAQRGLRASVLLSMSAAAPISELQRWWEQREAQHCPLLAQRLLLADLGPSIQDEHRREQG